VRIEWYGQEMRSSKPASIDATNDTDWTLLGHPAPDLQRKILYEDDDVVPGVRYAYRLVLLDVDRVRELRRDVGLRTGEYAPAAIRLETPRPNPFVTRVTLTYGLPHEGRVRLALYDVKPSGCRVRRLLEPAKDPHMPASPDTRQPKLSPGLSR
jgi:hypothetical protein